jgi:hypothetical protein
MIIPFNSFGIWFEELKVGDGWRVCVRNGGGIGKDTFFDSAIYTEEMAVIIASQENQKIHMT